MEAFFILSPGLERQVAIAGVLSKNLRMLEVDDAVLDEIITRGCHLPTIHLCSRLSDADTSRDAAPCRCASHLSTASDIDVPLPSPPQGAACCETLSHDGGPGRACIKGRPDEEAVLCTATATYDLKHVETTNALLLVTPQQVRGSPNAADWQAAPIGTLVRARRAQRACARDGCQPARAVLQSVLQSTHDATAWSQGRLPGAKPCTDAAAN